MPARLDTPAREFFNENGYYLFHEPVFRHDEDFGALASTFEELLSEWTEQRGSRPEHMDVPHFYHPELFRWLLHDDVLDVVESLIGPDIALWSSHFVCKPSGDGRRVPWHEDSAYWGTVIEPMDVVTLWLAIDPSTPENGCMQVIPGSHRNGYSDYLPTDQSQEATVFDTEITAGSFDPSRAVDCTLAPNEASLHHAKMIHGSAANHSQQRRCGYTMRYMSSACRYNGEAHGKGHKIYLARGRDRSGSNRYGDPTQPNLDYQRIAGHGLPFERLISHRMPLEQATAGFDLMARGEASKVVFTISEEPQPL